MKTFIKNRKGEKICVVVDEITGSKGLAFVMHGLSGYKEQLHIKEMIQSFLDNNISVVSFDTTNTFGESDGNYENATVTNYYEDLEDVIKWSENKSFYQEKFFLAGHSLGGICSLLFAQKYPEKIKAIAPISTVVSGKLSFETHEKEELEKWKSTGYHISESKSKPGIIKKLKWSHMEDRLQYDTLKQIDKITFPVLLIVGKNDTTTPLLHQQVLYDNLPGKKELHIIKDSGHTFRSEKSLQELYSIFDTWIKQVI